MRGGWLYCSISCAREPGASNRAWFGRLQGRGEEPLLAKPVPVERPSGFAFPFRLAGGATLGAGAVGNEQDRPLAVEHKLMADTA
jgi:hypothetical protein